jgi:hypothetical protein
MKSLVRIIGLCLAAVFTMSMALTASASAAGPVWEQCREGSGAATKWEDNLCSKASSGGKWQWIELTSTEKTISSGTITLKDIKTLVGTAEVTCSEKGEGTVGPGKFAVIRTFELEKCKADKGCEEVTSAGGTDLPWQTELIETESAIREDGGGVPGWSVTCTVLKVKTSVTCTTNTARYSLGFSLSWIWYLLTWLPSTAKSSCTEGGAGSGEVEGYIELASAAGWRIRA